VPENPISHVALSKGRLEALSDGLFAIVMTLLVLELKVPELPRNVDQAEILHKLREMWPAFFSYVVTFIIASSIWLLHHLTFHFIRHTTRALCWINLMFLMFVSLLPFSTAMMGHFLNRPVGMFFYFGNQTLVTLGLFAHWQYALRHDLVNVDVDARSVKRLGVRIAMLPAGFSGAFLMALYRPDFAIFALLLVMLAFRVWERRSKS